MSAAMPSNSSNKGYSPVPVEPIPERIDDGLDVPAEDADAEDDENLYTPSAPLLSSRSRGIEDSEPRGSKQWFYKISQSWRKPFRRDPYTWTPATKKFWTWRKITLATVLVTLVSAVIGLSISTAILAKRARNSSPSYWQCRNRERYERHTRLPLNELWSSSNFQLDFVSLYPPVRPSRNYACESAWSSLRYVGCHEKIFTRAWDNGQFNLFDPEIGMYSEPLCDLQCIRKINTAYQAISTQCSEDDVFDMTNYLGTFSLDPGLESGPLGVITTIQNRLMHTCREEPQIDHHYWSRPKCTQVMWDDWKIVDGINAGNLEGLDNFLKRTESYRRLPAHNEYIQTYDTCDNIDSYNFRSRWAPERYVGPGVNTTTCGWCTINWFERKLLSWKKNEVRDPKTGNVVSLPTYLNRIKEAGERCEADSWDRIWARALKKYKAQGDLDRDWGNDGKNGDKKKPCKDEDPQDDDGLVTILPISPVTPTKEDNYPSLYDIDRRV